MYNDCTAPAQSPQHLEACTNAIQFPCGICGDCTASALASLDFRKISAQPQYGLSLRAHVRNCTMPVPNIKAYTVAHTQLRCLNFVLKIVDPFVVQELGSNIQGQGHN